MIVHLEQGGIMKHTRRIIMILVFALVCSLAFSPVSVMAESILLSMDTDFRCGNLLMREGVEKLQVMVNCGEPVASERSYIDRYGEVDKLFYGPDAGYYYVLYFYVGKLIKVESIREL